MFPELYKHSITLLSIILIGISIKLLDDFIDEDKSGYIPYIMLLLVISIYLCKDNTTLFLCSYIVGMFHDERLKLISTLKAYQEQIIVLIIGILIGGLRNTISALFIIMCIQLIDDITDENQDKLTGKKNWSLVLGRFESVVILLIFFCICIYLDKLRTIVCILSSMIISYLFNSVMQKYNRRT